MADGDYAILVGISRYRRSEQFGPLDGPLNDIARIREWLVAVEGLRDENVLMLPTPEALMSASPPTSAGAWTPTAEQFSETVYRLVVDEHDNPIRRQGRLYMFCSGHGFSMARERTTGAAVYAANASTMRPSNIAGSLYAEIIRQGAYFREIVLIMDCCRDYELDSAFTEPDLTTAEHDNAERVKVLALYATPKRGKAQERQLAEAGDRVVGLFTHGFLRALREAPMDVLGRVSSTVLRGYLDNHWDGWFTDPKPPQPRVLVPESGEIFFRSRADAVEQTFSLACLQAGQIVLLQSASLLAQGTLGVGCVHWRNSAWDVTVPLTATDDGLTMALTLTRAPHTLLVIGAGQPPVVFQPGSGHVQSLPC